MVAEVVHSVLSDNTNRRVTTMEETVKEEASKKTAAKRKASPRKPKTATKEAKPENPPADEWVGKPCPLCGKGTIIKGKKLLTGVPNGRTAAPFANRSDRCRKVSVVPHHAKHIRQITATDTPLLRI